MDNQEQPPAGPRPAPLANGNPAEGAGSGPSSLGDLPPEPCRSNPEPKPRFGHPRLYFDRAELVALRAERDRGRRPVIWHNLMDSAEWCRQRPLRRQWIAPVSPDPIYANLYDRFYAMMHDMAVMEHLAFAWAYGQDEGHGAAARQWAVEKRSVTFTGVPAKIVSSIAGSPSAVPGILIRRLGRAARPARCAAWAAVAAAS